MKIKKIRCAHCRQWFKPDPRAIDPKGGYRQRFCPQAACRKASKKEAQARWWAKNAHYYKGDARKSQIREWAKDHPDYWQDWRRDHPDYVERNRCQQKFRDQRRRFLAKQDEIRLPIEGILNYMTARENLAKQEIIAPSARPAP